MAGYSTAVTREAAWFTADPPASFPSAPLLRKKTDPTAPFDVVQGHRPRDEPRPGRNSLYVYLDPRKSQRQPIVASGEMREPRYFFIAHIVWSFQAASRLAEEAEQELENAIERVLTRIDGPYGDKTHGGAFANAGALGDEAVVEYAADPLDAIRTRGQVDVMVCYGASDFTFD
jgi:hypothetical protein